MPGSATSPASAGQPLWKVPDMAQVTCRLCGSLFEPTARAGLRGGKIAELCSGADCRRAYYRAAARKYREKVAATRSIPVCLECQSSFEKTGNRRYCSESCRITALLRRRRESEYNPLDRFCLRCGTAIEARSGKRLYCSAGCRNAANGEAERFRLKGLSPALAQVKECALCGADDRSLVIDHDHDCCPGQKACGRCFRGMLCHGHNVALGLFGEDPELLRRAAQYIEDARARKDS